MADRKCPECGSDDVDLLDPETACCGVCGHEARPVFFDPEGEAL